MRLKKRFFSVCLSLAISSAIAMPSVTVNAASEQPIQVEDITATINQLTDGITIVLTKNEDDTFNQKVYYNTLMPQSITTTSNLKPMATADGVLEWAVFHLGFKNWNDDTGDLYYTISADEPMYSVSGDAYVKSTSILFPKSFYKDSFSSRLYSSTNTSRTLETDVDTEDEKKVRVGFSNVVLETIAGEYGYFANSSQIVER
ncbi:MAG: hypothetical protein H2184_13570 [Candidatus Galacturonibacter soehngenii]|nr:hypothetical protein [Candidatus Galacturonibacter soehngenii]